MIQFFRKIRHRLLTEGKTIRYLKYAVGEIILVVIGILIALQINNWKERRQAKLEAIQMYENLLFSLQQDSTEIARIISIQGKSIAAQTKLITASWEELNSDTSQGTPEELVFQVGTGALSFFPQYGVYNSIVSGNKMDLLQSNAIKVALVNLYDHKYKRYENIDAIVDQKYQFEIFPVIDVEMMEFSAKESPGVFSFDKEVDTLLLEKHFENLVKAIKDTHRIMNAGYSSLLQTQDSMHRLIEMIRVELQEIRK